MTIKIHCVEKNFADIINVDVFEGNVDEINKLFENNIYLEINREIITKLNDCGLMINNEYAQYYPLDFPSSINFEIIFVPESFKDEIVEIFQINTESPLGFHAITTGDGFLNNGSYYNKKFQSFVFIPDNNTFIDNVLSESDPLSYLHSSANTLTHELSHMLLFAMSSGGLSPYDIDLLFDSSEFDNSIEDCILGSNLDEYEELYISQNAGLDCNEILENIVEEKGFILLSKIDLHFNKKLEKIELISNMHEYKQTLPLK